MAALYDFGDDLIFSTNIDSGNVARGTVVGINTFDEIDYAYEFVDQDGVTIAGTYPEGWIFGFFTDSADTLKTASGNALTSRRDTRTDLIVTEYSEYATEAESNIDVIKS